MSVIDSWRPLVHDKKELPSLILRANVYKDGYAVYLSDLEHIWAEELTKDALVERAQELNCSIDPSQDLEQYHIFARKLTSALEQEANTSLELKSSRSGTNITLSVSVALPRPLQKLEWEVHLQRRDDGLVGAELSGPLINRAHTLQQQTKLLISELRAKDHVLSRLIDKLEATGIPLSEVFPNVSTIRGPSKQPMRERLAPYIRGLAPLDDEAWSSQAESSAEQADGLQNILSEVLPKLSIKHGASIGHKATWWRGLDVEIASSSTHKQEYTSSELEDSTLLDLPARPGEDSSTDDGDEFQLVARSSPAELEANGGESERPSTPNIGTSPSRRTKKLDRPALGKDIDTTSPAMPMKKLGALGGNKSAPQKEFEQDSLPQPPQPPPNPNSKLGTFGGKKSVENDVATGRQSAAMSESTSPLPRRTRKLGAMGGRDATVETKQECASSVPCESTVKSQGRVAPTPAAESTEPKVPLEEKADYRRDQLKRLQEQTKPTTKKKRKF